jgi:hypothetical protein
MEGSHLNHVRLDHAKNNLGPKWTEPHWFKFEAVPVGLESEAVGVLRPVVLTGQEDNRLEILAEAMAGQGLAEVRATTLIGQLPEQHKRVFGRNRANWSHKVQDAFIGPPKHETEWGTLSWSCAGERSPLMLKLQSASSA